MPLYCTRKYLLIHHDPFPNHPELTTFAMAKTGLVQVDEGRLFWKYDPLVYYKDNVRGRPRPV